MAKMPNRMVLVIENKVNEFGDPVVNFESKDYAECVIEELENIKADIKEASYDRLDGFNGGQIVVDWEDIEDMFYDRISELKGGTE